MSNPQEYLLQVYLLLYFEFLEITSRPKYPYKVLLFTGSKQNNGNAKKLKICCLVFATSFIINAATQF